MKKQSLLTNVLLVILVIMIALFIYVTYGTYKKFSHEQSRMQAFYIADKGLNQAIMYLSEAPGNGGKGPTWRTKGHKEPSSVGAYTLSVVDISSQGDIAIKSVGEVKGTKVALYAEVVYGKALPDVFNFAVFSGSALELSKDSLIYGNVFVSDQLTFNDCSSVRSGQAYTAPGYNVICLDDPMHKSPRIKGPTPFLPMLDTTSYYNLISTAKTAGAGVIQGDRDFQEIKLEGDILVNGNVTLKGAVKGRGSIVSTRNMTLKNGASLDDGVSLICDGKLVVEGSHSVSGTAHLYSKQRLSFQDNCMLRGKFVILSPTLVELGDGSCVNGLAYAPTIYIGKGVRVNGSIATQNFVGIYGGRPKPGLLDDAHIKYDAALLPPSVAGFNVGTKSIILKPGSVKEI